MSGTDLVNKRCPLCDSDPAGPYARYYTHLFGDRIMAMKLVRCVNCDLIFVSPQPHGNEIDALYGTDKFTADQNKATVGRGELPDATQISPGDKVWKIEKLEQFVGGGRLLDIGCGFGALMKAAENRGRWETHGIDPSPAAVRFVREKLGLKARCSSVFDMDFPPSSFDAVCMDNVLEHIDRPIECMRAVSRVLRPGGVVFIDVPNIRGVACRLWRLYLKLFPREGQPNTYGHLYFYTRKSMAILLEKTGFEPRRMLTDQTTFLGDARGLEQVLRRIAIAAGQLVPGAGNLLVAFAMKKTGGAGARSPECFSFRAGRAVAGSWRDP